MIDAFRSNQSLSKDWPPGIRFHPGHTWAYLIGLELAFVGATDFAIAFTGDLAGVSLPREFNLIRAGQPAWTLISKRGRRLQQVSPLGGRILVANSYLLENAGELRRSPYDQGWVLCVQSPSIPYELRTLFSHEADQVSLDRTLRSMKRVLGSSVRLPLEDKVWRPAFGDEFTDEEWEALRSELFPVPQPPVPRVERNRWHRYEN
jgi:glycine cleavage system H lipoate-binding protein